MQLHSVLVENFRGIRRAEVSFSRDTVLIGENDSGKSRVIEALCLVLNSSSGIIPFEPCHFCVPVEEANQFSVPIRITITFAERHKGEWSSATYQPIQSLLAPESSRQRELRLEVHAASADAKPRIRFFSSGGALAGSESPELLAWVRANNPIIRLEQGLLNQGGRNGPVRNKEIQSYSDLVDRHYAALVGGASTNATLDLEAGFKAAQTLVALSSQHLDANARRTNWLLEEIAGSTLKLSSRFANDSTSAPPSGNSYKIGLLLFVGALLRAHSQPFGPDAEPIVIFEDPEAHLHPLTLASVWSLIERMRWQTIVSTHSGVLLTEAPLHSIRRLIRVNDEIIVHRVRDRALTKTDMRKFRYHVRSRRGAAMFARCWLLVEGETEFWLLPELARLLGYNFDAEGISCVEFAQCGIPPLVKAARELGIEWHLLTDGDNSGAIYSATAGRFCGPNELPTRITRLREPDIEHCFWHSGYANAILKLAGRTSSSRPNPRWIIRAAIDKSSKPYLALQLLEAVASSGSAGVPPALKRVIESCVRMARRTNEQSAPDVTQPALKDNLLHMEARK
ncbi:ATP-dependent endonuclease of the OLD family [Candidatus Koribacter versatilis Ellin345]|uniref:ATP-dependent endonuclease of the OLD family n=1 Tax=Koribacter versatilis (strain Ellin345) TaxID=204669 RepID=Q1IJ67_KORVE|nr:DUF2813 domain-containing protein [Candidatus Koribacter versatilis]ABF43083.1 ATP-dependent endonuclease of the OLD family [Candidatus Koribacter versatilis Ellin345]